MHRRDLAEALRQAAQLVHAVRQCLQRSKKPEALREAAHLVLVEIQYDITIKSCMNIVASGARATLRRAHRASQGEVRGAAGGSAPLKGGQATWATLLSNVSPPGHRGNMATPDNVRQPPCIGGRRARAG